MPYTISIRTKDWYVILWILKIIKPPVLRSPKLSKKPTRLRLLNERAVLVPGRKIDFPGNKTRTTVDINIAKGWDWNKEARSVKTVRHGQLVGNYDGEIAQNPSANLVTRRSMLGPFPYQDFVASWVSPQKANTTRWCRTELSVYSLIRAGKTLTRVIWVAPIAEQRGIWDSYTLIMTKYHRYIG